MQKQIQLDYQTIYYKQSEVIINKLKERYKEDIQIGKKEAVMPDRPERNNKVGVKITLSLYNKYEVNCGVGMGIGFTIRKIGSYDTIIPEYYYTTSRKNLALDYSIDNMDVLEEKCRLLDEMIQNLENGANLNRIKWLKSLENQVTNEEKYSDLVFKQYAGKFNYESIYNKSKFLVEDTIKEYFESRVKDIKVEKVLPDLACVDNRIGLFVTATIDDKYELGCKVRDAIGFGIGKCGSEDVYVCEFEFLPGRPWGKEIGGCDKETIMKKLQRMDYIIKEHAAGRMELS